MITMQLKMDMIHTRRYAVCEAHIQVTGRSGVPGPSTVRSSMFAAIFVDDDGG
jgi:hypothetical protein